MKKKCKKKETKVPKEGNGRVPLVESEALVPNPRSVSSEIGKEKSSNSSASSGALVLLCFRHSIIIEF